jgi:hypothetical protein
MLNRARFDSIERSWENRREYDEQGDEIEEPLNSDLVAAGDKAPSVAIKPAKWAEAMDQILGEIMGMERKRGEPMADFYVRFHDEVKSLTVAWLDD